MTLPMDRIADEEVARAQLMGVDPALADDIAWMLVRIKNNLHREGSFPPSRFAGMRLEYIQACAVIREIQATTPPAPPPPPPVPPPQPPPRPDPHPVDPRSPRTG